LDSWRSRGLVFYGASPIEQYRVTPGLIFRSAARMLCY
jgi:hypothetical protein